MAAGVCGASDGIGTSRIGWLYPKDTLGGLRVGHGKADLAVPFVELLAVRVEVDDGHLLSGRQVDRIHRLELAPVLCGALPDERSRLVLDEVVKLDRLDRCPRRPQGIDCGFGLLIKRPRFLLALDVCDL